MAGRQKEGRSIVVKSRVTEWVSGIAQCEGKGMWMKQVKAEENGTSEGE